MSRVTDYEYNLYSYVRFEAAVTVGFERVFTSYPWSIYNSSVNISRACERLLQHSPASDDVITCQGTHVSLILILCEFSTSLSSPFTTF